MKRYKRFLALLLVGFCILSVYLHVRSLWQESSSSDGQNEHLLIRPVFAQTSGSTFLEQEAGISIYMKVDTTIDLTKAKTVYKNIEKETSEYIIGSISLPDLPEIDDAHCFVHTAGWIVVYYLKTEPVGKIIDWNYYSNGVLTKTKLQVGLEKMALALGLSATDLKYYHFQYPYADKWMIIIETQPGYGSDSFRIKIPSTFTIYERSWIHNKAYGTITVAQLSPDIYHTVTAEVSSYYSYLKIDGTSINSIYDDNYSYVAIILVYKEA